MDPEPVVLLIGPAEDRIRLLDALEREQAVTEQIHTAADGDEARAFLQREDTPKPNLIVLETDRPETDGYALIDYITDQRPSIPVVVLSESDDPETVAAVYDNGANAHVPKPDDDDEFHEAVRVIEAFWFETVALPPEDADDNGLLQSDERPH